MKRIGLVACMTAVALLGLAPWQPAAATFKVLTDHRGSAELAGGSRTLLFESYTSVTELPGSGWPVFGAVASITEFGEPWITVPAAPIHVDGTWRIETIQLVAFGEEWVTGGAAGGPRGAQLLFYADNGGLPGDLLLEAPPLIIEGQMLEYVVSIAGLEVTNDTVWVALVRDIGFGEDTRLAWAQSTTTGSMAKSVNAGQTWDQLGSPFSAVALPAMKIMGEVIPDPPADNLFANYQTLAELPGNGYSVFGRHTCLEIYEQGWEGTGVAIQVTIPRLTTWVPSEIIIPGFNQTWVTGEPADPELVKVNIYADLNGVPDRLLASAQGLQVGNLTEGSVQFTQAVPLTGTVWFAVMPTTELTKMGWAQSTSAGRIAKSINNGGTWNEMGSPFEATQPAIAIRGKSVPGTILYRNFVTATELPGNGYPILGADACASLLSQNWAGTCVALKLEIPRGSTWIPSGLDLVSFNESWVTGDPAPADAMTMRILGDASGLPDPANVLFEQSGLSAAEFTEYAVDVAGSLALKGNVWLSFCPETPDGSIGWAKATSSGTIAKSISMGATWNEMTSPVVAELPALSITGREVQGDILYSNYETLEQLPGNGYAAFGATACQTIFEQPWPGTGVAVKVTVPRGQNWLIDKITVGAFNASWVTGEAALPDAFQCSIYGDNSGVPDPEQLLASLPAGRIEGFAEVNLTLPEMTEFRGSFWIALLPVGLEAKVGWAQTTSSGNVAKSITNGQTWNEMGSPFSAAEPAITITGRQVNGNVLYTNYTTSYDLPGNGYPVFGADAVTEVFGEVWEGTAVAMKIQVPTDTSWLLDSLSLPLFESSWVTGEPHPLVEIAQVRLYGDLDGVPNPARLLFTTTDVRVDSFNEVTVNLANAPAMKEGFWIALAPTLPTTKMAWAQTADAVGTVAKSITNCASWNDLGSPFIAALPAMTLTGREVSGNVLFHNYTDFDSLVGNGYPVLGGQACWELLQQEWPATAVACKVDAGINGWTPESIQIAAFNSSWVTGDPSVEEFAQILVVGDNAGVPNPDLVYAISDVLIGREGEAGAPLTMTTTLSGAFWVVLAPGNHDARIGFAASNQTGAVAKSITAGQTWNEMGSPFMISQPALMLKGQEVPCTHHGDVNFDGSYTAGDAQSAFYMALGFLDPTFAEACAADCNNDGSITAGDAQIIFGAALGMMSCFDPIGPIEPQMSMTAMPLLRSNSAAALEPQLSDTLFLETGAACPGEQMIVAVVIENHDSAIDAFTIDVSYDPDSLKFSDCDQGELVPEIGWVMFDCQVVSPGVVRVAGFTVNDGITTGKLGSLFDLNFTVIDRECVDRATSGLAILRIQDALSGFVVIDNAESW